MCAFQIHGDGEPMLFYYQSNNTRAVNVVMKRDISNSEHFSNLLDKSILFDLSTPYGLGGFLLEGDNNEAVLMELDSVYSAWCQRII